MQKFLAGTLTGVIFALAFVWFDLKLPAIFDLPDKVKKNVVSTAVEGELYDLTQDIEIRERALEVYLKNRAGDAVKVDAAAGHPFLTALYHARARREARELTAQWDAYDTVLAKPALRATLETKHGVAETEALKRAMLLAALSRKPFLKTWLERAHGAVTADRVRSAVTEAARP